MKAGQIKIILDKSFAGAENINIRVCAQKQLYFRRKYAAGQATTT